MGKERTANMTQLSRLAFSEATTELHSVEDAVIFLKKELVTRNVRSILEKFSKGRDIKTVQKMLVEGLAENRPNMERSAVERRIRIWMDPKSAHTLKKQDAIEAAFHLQLTGKEADEFLALISEEKLHWRDVEEIVYGYGLEHHLSYGECRKILDRPGIQEVLQKVSDYQTVEEIVEDGYTEFVKRDVERLDTVEELETYLQENYEKLGEFHNTAYDIFREMLERLMNPASEVEELHLFDEVVEKETYTVRDIIKDLLYQEPVLAAKQKAVKSKKEVKEGKLSKEQQYTLDIIQKKIADSWPDEVSISKMKNRRMDVTRKVLILLFLVTDGDYQEEEEESEWSAEEVFEDVIARLDDMLFFCGYSALDPRNPFDWLVIYCIYVEDLLDIDPKMQAVLNEVYC